ncbi:TonB-dependent receptor plug domain-containing protein [Muriicola soli]|uniref:TonB-dependent receptor n=1 Tax=Muriicola soli TaxID=2507538 RepID=A0A411EA55_9FLAO|nr:TonB-dependent receptor plug domain-containing protein [Muriicola soli]QBA64433.1 TonB-dependent receptor [Muriicola soli]
MVKNFWSAGVLLIIGTVSWAQQTESDSVKVRLLDEVVVSDTRFPIRRENSGKTVIRIGAEELRRNQGRSLPELINNKSGIEISGSRGRAGEVLGVFVRGGRGRQVIVVIDGVRVSDPSSFSQEFDLRLLPLTSIASVEIIKGASSTLYGANAATAVINITTKDAPDKKLTGNFSSIIGTNQTTKDQKYQLNSFENSARVAGSSGKWDYAVGFANRYTDGMSSISTEANEADPFSAINLNARIGYKISDQFKARVYASQAKLKSAYDESFGLQDAPYQFESTQNRVGINTVYDYSKGSTTLNMAYTTYDSENFSAFPGTFKGQNLIGDFFNKYQSGNFRTIAGINYNLEQTEFEEEREFSFIDPYLSLVYFNKNGFQFTTGGRLNIHSEYGSQFVYNINPSYILRRDNGYFKALASFATAYLTPSLTQLFGQFGANPELRPETNQTLEFGLEYAIDDRLRVSTVVFSREEKDFVFFDNVNFLYDNAENTIQARGFEMELDWFLTEDLSLKTNYTFTEREGDASIRIPKHKIFTDLGYQVSEAFLISANYAYTGTRTDTDFNTFTEVPLEAFGLLGLSARYELMPDLLTVFIQGDNLLNTSYREVLGFNTRGRNFRMGFTLRFQ